MRKSSYSLTVKGLKDTKRFAAAVGFSIREKPAAERCLSDPCNDSPRGRPVA